MTLDVPGGVDWWAHRILSSERYTVSLRELLEDWTLADVLDAHLVLDAFLAAEIAASQR